MSKRQIVNNVKMSIKLSNWHNIKCHVLSECVDKNIKIATKILGFWSHPNIEVWDQKPFYCEKVSLLFYRVIGILLYVPMV